MACSPAGGFSRDGRVIEPIMYFTLGALSAILAAFATLPAFWRRAYRISRRHVESMLPVSPAEIAAERDQLRAAFAVERRQLELRLDKASAQRHDDQVELGRRLAAIADRDGTVRDLSARIRALDVDVSERDLRIAGLSAELAETAQALEGTRLDLGDLRRAHDALKDTYRALLDVADARRVEIDELTTRRDSLAARVHELERAELLLRNTNRERADEVRTLERSRRELLSEKSILQGKLAAAEALVARRDASLAERDAERAALKETVDGLARQLASLERADQDKAKRLVVADARVTELEMAHREARKALTDLRAEKITADGLLAQAKLDIAALERQLPKRRGMQPVDDGALARTLAELQVIALPELADVVPSNDDLSSPMAQRVRDLRPD